jgi:methylenetetrahydrofolate dehydrogenase (NADP+)/methenyltetrahydrofolate cyclohydrolase
MNVGYLSTQRPGLVPCTPAGIVEILKRSGIAIAGAEAVVVGRSDIVGKPVAMLLLNGNATVTVCHSKTRDLAAVCRRADILIAAIGKAGMITPDFVKPGATVIDVGMNTVTDPAEFEHFFAGNEKRERDFATKGDHPCTRRRRPAHHRHAHEQHGESGQAAARECSRCAGGALDKGARKQHVYTASGLTGSCWRPLLTFR